MKTIVFTITALVFSISRSLPRNPVFTSKAGFNLANVSITSDGRIDDAKSLTQF